MGFNSAFKVLNIIPYLPSVIRILSSIEPKTSASQNGCMHFP